MKYDIILAGVGGQGILSIATVIGYAALESGYTIKQSEVHGMSQMGGEVQSHLRISDGEIFSDLVPAGQADLILSVEPLESLRYLPYLSSSGLLITNTTPYENISNYPDIEQIREAVRAVPKHLEVDADTIASEHKNKKGMNMVMAGSSGVFLPMDFEKLEGGVRYLFGRKGEELVQKNIEVLRAGAEIAQKYKDRLGTEKDTKQSTARASESPAKGDT